MKHLKSFKVFESGDYLPMEGTEIWYNLNDMLLELEDIGYGTEVTDMSNKDEHVIGVQIDKRDENGVSSFKMNNDIKDVLFRLKDFMSDWKMIINSNRNYLYLTDDGRVIGSFGNPNTNWPTFTKLTIIFSKKVGVNEGFFTKIKDIIKPEEPKKIDIKEFEYTLDDCFIDLKDNDFIIDIKQSESMMSPIRSKGQKLDIRNYKSLIYYIRIIGPEKVVNNIRVGHDIFVPVHGYSKFKFGEIKDSLLFARDTIMSIYGIDIFYYKTNIDKMNENEEIQNFDFEFEIPVDMIKD